MMDYYIEFQVLPDLEFSEAILLDALFAKLHKAFVMVKNANIGISFPMENQKSLGDCLRLHGTQTALDNLMAKNWLQGLSGYLRQSAIKPIPLNVKYRTIRRIQTKSNAERLRRRSVAKGWLTAEEAIIKIPSAKEKNLNLPYLKIKSSSTNQAFYLFIQHGTIQDQPVAGEFNSYGLSLKATIPWF